MNKVVGSDCVLNKFICRDCSFMASSFKYLSDKELDLINDNKVHLTFNKGETIVKQKGFVTHVLFVKKGLVKVYNEVDYRTNLIYSIHTSGAFLGLASLFGNNHYQYSISALEDSYICAIDREVFEKLMTENNAFAISILKTINSEVLLCREKMVTLTMKQLNGRLAETLLYLSNVVYNSLEFTLSLSRKDLAELSNMSTMSVVRTLQDFIKGGYIENDTHKMKILDKDKLFYISQNG